MDDLRPYIRSSPLALSIRYVQSDIAASDTNYVGPWPYKNKKDVWIHYSISSIGTINEKHGKILLQNLLSRGFPKKGDPLKVPDSPVKRKSDSAPATPFKKLSLNESGQKIQWCKSKPKESTSKFFPKI